MSQTWTDDPFASGNVGQTDLQNMENNFLAMKSMFSGASAPANAVAGMPWFDTAQKVKKTRNNDNDAWLGLFHGDASQKILVYDDSVLEGYLRDSSVTDKAVALKGGATYTTAGDTAGSFTVPTHALSIAELAAHTHTLAGRTNRSVRASGFTSEPEFSGTDTTVATNSTGSGTAHGHGELRPAAAVTILVYLDL